MPIQPEETNRFNNTITRIHDFVSPNDLENLLAGLSNFPDFLKAAIKQNQFAVYVEIKEESPGNAEFNALFSRHDCIRNFIKEVLLQINDSYWGSQEDNKESINNYINQMDENWSSKRKSTCPYKYIVNISNVAGTGRGGFNPELDCIKLNYDFGGNYDDINTPACILAHELTHAVDYNRGLETYYSSCSNISDISSETIASILRIFGVNDQLYDPIKYPRELVAYTIQSFLAYEEIIFKQKLSSIQPAAERERFIKIIQQCINDYLQALQPTTVECLKKISTALENINICPGVSSQQVLANSDSKFIIEEIAPRIKMLEWLPDVAIDYINRYSNQEKLQSELKDSNGAIGIWFLIQCLNDPKKCVNGWETLSLQQQIEKYNALVDRFKIEQVKNNPYIQSLKRNLQPPVFLLQQLFGENYHIFEKSYFDGMRPIQAEQLMERTGIEKESSFNLLQINEYTERKQIILEETNYHSLIERMQQLEETHFKSGQEQLKEHIDAVEKLFFDGCIAMHNAIIQNLSEQQLEEKFLFVGDSYIKVFELLKSVIENEPSWAAEFLAKFEEIIKKHEEQIAKIGLDRIRFKAMVEAQKKQLVEYRQQLQSMIAARSLLPNNLIQPAAISGHTQQPHSQQPTISSTHRCKK